MIRFLLILVFLFDELLDGFHIGHLEFENSNETFVLKICMKNSTENTLTSLPSCHNFNGLENAANLNYQKGVDLFIGAACDEETQTVSRLALRWHKIYLSSALLSTKEKEETTIALKPHSLAGTAEVILAVCKSMGWKEIGFIHSEETKYNVHAIYDILSERFNETKINVFLQTDGHLNTYTILHSTRVIFSFLSLKHLGTFMKTLKEKADRPLEYPIVHIDFNRTTPQTVYDFLDNLAYKETNPITVARLRKLHKHVAVLYNIHDDQTNMEAFARKYKIKPSHYLYKALILCDGMQLLANFSNSENGTKISEDLPRLWQHVTNTEIHGYSGPVFIGNDGVRLPYYDMFMWRERHVYHVASIQPRDKTFCQGYPNCYEVMRTEEGVILDDFPPYYDTCGYDSKLCSDSHVFIIAAIVFSVLLIPLGIAFYLQRKEHLIEKMPWRVPLEALSFSDGNDSISVRRVSVASSIARQSYASIFMANIIEHAFFNKQKVSVKRYIQRRAITFSRQEMELLNQMKYLNHTNVNPFCGICFNQGNEMLVMWQFTTRHSLEDLIFVKEQKFGRNFQSTFIKHILHGVQFIHNSSIKVHGALYLSNCVVDSYWVVKITDFGARNILAEKIHHKELLPMIPFDGDAIHYKYLQQAPEHLQSILEKNEEPTGTVEGDIYQLAMLIYQVLFYMRPFAERPQSIKDIAEAIINPQITAQHPKVPEESAFTMRLLSIMQQCWLYKPQARPTLLKINDAVNREFGQDAKGTLIDQMIEMIDEYSANLEQIVSERTRELEQDMSKTENLLYQLLPKSIADSIRDGRTVHPEQHSSVSLLVVDVCQFTKFCEAFIPVHILETLQELYSSFDFIVQKNKAFKVENVGDAYLICSGIPEMRDTRHLREISKISLKFQAFMTTFKVRHRPEHRLEIKQGITSGAVAAGVLGSTAPRFCLFGDTVNMACRMASTSAPGKIQISELTANMMIGKFPNFELEERGMVDVKGKGSCLTFWLNGEKEKEKRLTSRNSTISQIKFEGESSNLLRV